MFATRITYGDGHRKEVAPLATLGDVEEHVTAWMEDRSHDHTTDPSCPCGCGLRDPDGQECGCRCHEHPEAGDSTTGRIYWTEAGCGQKEATG